jgi:hypothetical protein
MVEAKGDEFNLQMLQTLQRMDARMDKLEGWLERLGAEFIRTRTELRADMQQMERGLRADMQQLERGLRTDMQQLGTELRTEMQHVRTELRTEMKQLRVEVREDVQQVRAEMQEGFRLVHGRIDRTNEAVSMVGSLLHQQTTERFERLEARVLVLEKN